MPRCQKSRRWQYRRKPAHLAERRNPKRCDNIINIAYLSIHNMRIIAQGHESIFSPGLRWAMVFARYPRAYAVAGWQHTQAQGPEVAFRGCNPIGVHRAFGCQSCHPGEAGTSQPTRPFPRGTIKERQVASRASQTLGTRLGGPLSTLCGHPHRSGAPANRLSCLTTVSGSKSFEQAATGRPFHILCRSLRQ